MLKRRNKDEHGAIAIYIVLMVLFTVTSAALILSSVLSRQLRASQDIISAERAFYAANSGLEEGFARLLESSDGEPVSLSGEIEYDDESASYEGQAQLVGESGVERGVCIATEGDSRGRQRRLSIQPAGHECEF